MAENPDGSLDAVCFVDGDSILAPDIDLGAWLIEQGFAVATPEAPFEYAVPEPDRAGARPGRVGLPG